MKKNFNFVATLQGEPAVLPLLKRAAALTSDLDGEVGDALPLKIETIKHAINFFK